MNIAIFSPSKNPYSETFIQAHKNYLKETVFYYYGTGNAIKLEGAKTLVPRYYFWFLMLVAKLFKKPGHFLRDKKLQYSLKKNHIDVILVEYGTHAHYLLMFLRSCKIPVVVHFHGFDASVYKTLEACDNYQDVFMMASKVVAVSKVMEQRLLSLGCPREKLIYNVYGPQPEFKDVIPVFSKLQFVAIGRFTDKKAPYYTILAFKEVVSKYPNARLLMAGNGDLLNACINLVRYSGLEEQVQFLGVITPEHYRVLLAESLAFVQHSITADNGDMEGTPVAILEASAAGLPVISTFHAGIPDVVVHEETGLLCAEHDVKTMAENMLLVLEDMIFAKRLGSAGKIRIAELFSLERHINQLQDLLDSVTA